MEWIDEVTGVNQDLEHMLIDNMLLSRIAYGIVGIMCIVFLAIATYKLINRRWNSIFFILLCIAAIFWSGISLLALFAEDYRVTDFLNSLRYIGLVPIPALLVLHISLQVSYKGLRPYTLVLYLAVPVFYMIFVLRDLYLPQAFTILPPLSASRWYIYVFCLFTFVALIRSYLLCFNVLYQMPPRTRRSTKSIFVSVVTLTLMATFYILQNSIFEELLPQNVVFDVMLPLIIPIALGFIIYPLFDSMYIMPASDVIVTSREFVMKGLNTTVFVLSQKEQILDWNKKDWGSGYLLPKPKYREPFRIYLKRMLSQHIGKVSTHNPEVFIITKNGEEIHFLLRKYEVGYNQKKFGYIVEITEVTSIYSKLRDFEQIAHIDRLTGLYNRNAYLDYTSQLVKDEKMPLTILVGDLNELKRINDVHGHLEGDELIRFAAKAINDAKPENAFVARVGGDEFVVLVPNSNEDTAEVFIKKVNMLCGTKRDEKQHVPSISWGHALMISSLQSYNELFEEADKMMYEYKKQRKEFSSSGILPERK